MQSRRKQTGWLSGWVMLGAVFATSAGLMAATEDELVQAAEELAKVGRGVAGGAVPTVKSPPVTGTSRVVAPVTSAVPSPFRGKYKASLGDDRELVAIFSEGKVEWTVPGRRSYIRGTVSTLSWNLEGNKLTILRDSGPPWVYTVSDDRKELIWQSGEMKEKAAKLVLVP